MLAAFSFLDSQLMSTPNFIVCAPLTHVKLSLGLKFLYSIPMSWLAPRVGNPVTVMNGGSAELFCGNNSALGILMLALVNAPMRSAEILLLEKLKDTSLTKCAPKVLVRLTENT